MEQEEGAAPSRRRSSRSRGRSKPSGARQEKPNREAPSAKPGEGGEKKSRSRWHRRGHRRSGGQGSGSQTPPPQNGPTGNPWQKAEPPSKHRRAACFFPLDFP